MKNKRILVIVAHPDDEVLGCGASIRKWKTTAEEINALILAEGITSRNVATTDANANEIKKLHQNACEAAKIIGYNNIYFEKFPDNRMDSVNLLDVVHTILDYIKRLNPQIILTHHSNDLNVDHRIVYQAVITACRPLLDSIVEAIYSFQVPSSTEWNFPYYKSVFSPNFFVNIEDSIENKLTAMECYISERREVPHPRSSEVLRSIATVWGSVVGLHYAEAFETIYIIEK